jgi:UDP-N-acetylglucosamine acyltransferase
MDVPPFVTVGGHPAAAHGINSEGLQRRGFTAATIGQLRQAYKRLYRSGLRLEQAVVEIEALAAEAPELRALADFLRASRRGIVR